MLKKLSVVAAAVIAALAAGCVNSTKPVTTIQAEDDLSQISMVVGGQNILFTEIDFYGVTVGDVYFPHVSAHSLTAAVSTSQEGSVPVTIDSAQGINNYTTICSFTNIPAGTFDLVPGAANVVVFNSSTITGTTVNLYTQVAVENDLTNLGLISVAGGLMQVDSIGLVGVTVGNVNFPYIAGGYSTLPTGTAYFGDNVPVTIDSIVVFSGSTPYSFAYNNSASPLSMTITASTLNNISFSNAPGSLGVDILQALSLAKRKAR